MTEERYEQASRFGEQAAAADLPIGAVRQQGEALCRSQGWEASDPRWYEVALVANQAYRATEQRKGPVS
jgi:hypothetical protein